MLSPLNVSISCNDSRSAGPELQSLQAYKSLMSNVGQLWGGGHYWLRGITDETAWWQSGLRHQERLSTVNRAERTHHLLVKTPGGSASDFVIRSDRVEIGRSETCDIVLESAFVSRTHATIEVRNGAAYVADSGSRNGVLVNGRRLSKEHRLKPGDEIRVGDYTLEYTERQGTGQSTQLFLGSTGGTKDAIFVDTSAWEVWVGEEEVSTKLSLQEFTLLRLLFDQAGRLCSREELGDAIWGAGLYDFNMLHQLVYRVKKKVEPDPKSPRYLESIPGVGYKLHTGGLS